jgi:hypothetical protein
MWPKRPKRESRTQQHSMRLAQRLLKLGTPPQPPGATRPPGTTPKVIRQRIWQFARRSWGWFLVILTVVGIPRLIDSYRTRISVTPGAPLRPRDILSTPFTVKNEGSLDLRKVQATCLLDTLFDSRTGNLFLENSVIAPEIAILPPNGTRTIGCWADESGVSAFGAPTWTDARLTIKFTYKNTGINAQREYSTGFRGMVQEDGSLRWVAAPPLH